MTNKESQPRFDGADAWAKLTSEQQAAIGAIALELIVCENGEDAHGGDHRLGRIFWNGCAHLQQSLMETACDALLDASPWLGDHELPVPIPSLLGPVCRVCGCAEHDACPEGCGWAEPDLCTSCVAAPGGAGTPICSDAADHPPQSSEG